MASPQERELKKAASLLEGPNDNQQQQQREAEQQKKPAEADEFSYRRVSRSAFKQKLVLGKKQKLLKLVLEDNDNQPQKQREEEKQQKSVKDDGFLYRRMTRSAFKQKLGSSNDGDSQQQQQLKAKKQKKSVKDTDDAEVPFLSAFFPVKNSNKKKCQRWQISNPKSDHSQELGLADDADNQKQHPRKGKRQEKLVKDDDDANSGGTKQKLGLSNDSVGNQLRQRRRRQQRMGEHKQWRIFTKK